MVEIYKAIRANGSFYFFDSSSLERAISFASDAILVGCTTVGH